MKKYIPIIAILSLIKLFIQILGNRNYGFHRDELLHLSVSEHLDWGFMEFPPFIGILGKLSYWLFDYNLLGMRMFSSFAGVAILILCCLIAIELGGKSKAVLLSGICILGFLPFYRNHTLFQPVAFDQLFWTLGFYYVVRYLKSEEHKYLLFIGFTLAIGILNKYTMLIWGFGIFVGLLFYKKGNLLKNKWFYISGGLALLLILPNLIWQIQNKLPIFRHLQALTESQLDEINPLAFGLTQLEQPFTFMVSLLGLASFFIDKHLKKYLPIGITALVIFFTMWVLKSKAYYVFALYPVLFAFGSVKIESLLSKKPTFIYAVASLILIPIIYHIPKATPILPIETFVKYTGAAEVNGRIELTNDYADMFGWEEQVKLVDSVYQTLTTDEKKHCVIWAENYGEAGALKILGKKYDLPNPICRSGSFWSWGFNNKNAKVWISIANEKPSVEYVFEEIELVKIIRHKYAIGEENRIPIYICRKPKIDIEQWWKDSEAYIFD